MTPLAIRLDDGRLITDPDWHTPSDVMRAAHGQGVTRMPGTLVRLSGWCSAPPGARPQHERCRAASCQCPCHDMAKESA